MSEGGENSFHPDVAYLLTPEISDILSKGLNEIYEKRPHNPVEYLAIWLLNKSKENLIKQEVLYFKIASLRKDNKKLWRCKKNINPSLKLKLQRYFIVIIF